MIIRRDGLTSCLTAGTLLKSRGNMLPVEVNYGSIATQPVSLFLYLSIYHHSISNAHTVLIQTSTIQNSTTFFKFLATYGTAKTTSFCK